MSCRRVGASGLTFDPVRVQRSKGTRSTSSMANRVHRIPFQRVTLSCQIMRHVQRLANYLTRIPEVTVTTRWVTDGLYRLHMRAKGRTERERERHPQCQHLDMLHFSLGLRKQQFQRYKLMPLPIYPDKDSYFL